MDIVIERLNNMENGYLNISDLNLPDLPDSLLWKDVKILECSYNRLTSLPNLPNVKILCCDNNQLTRLPDLPNIELLNCYINQLIALPDLPNVKTLGCFNNRLTRLPDLPKVKYLDCHNNPLIYKSKNRKVFNALFRIITVQKMFKHWRVVVRERQQERTYQIINQVSEFDILPEEIKLYIIRFI